MLYEFKEEKIYNQDQNEISIVFSASGDYFKYLIVSAISIIKNSNMKDFLHIYILHSNESEINSSKERVLLELKYIGYKNITFINVSRYLEYYSKINFYYQIHVDISTYFRFFIPIIFKNFSKLIYLDCDVIIEKPIEELYKINLCNAMLGAVKDTREILFAQQQNYISSINWRNYIINTLKMDNYKQYFQAGVLLLNPLLMYKNDITNKLIHELIRIKTPILSDQDVLNSVFYNQVTYIQQEWNIEWQIPFEFDNYKDVIPDELSDYDRCLLSPAILHYASPIKPWKDPNKKNAWRWWKYARFSLMYEDYIFNIKKQNKFFMKSLFVRLLKKMFNKVLPCETKRRAFIIKVYNKIR